MRWQSGGALSRPTRSRVRAAILVASHLVMTGCYALIPVRDAAAPAAGTRIRAELTDQGVVQMAAVLGPRVVALEGELAGVQPDAWEVLVTRIESRSGEPTFWNREPVTLPRSAVASVWEHRLDRRRSTLTAAGIIAAALIAAQVTRSAGASDSGRNGGGVPVE